MRQWKINNWARLAVGLTILCASSASAQLEFEQDPINYSASTPHDRIADLKEKLDAGSTTLAYSEEHGYLPALLDYLRVPTSSQVLVFSKTSLQRDRISPRTPRALYFDDDVYVGWVRNGDVMELSAADPNLGGVFYTLDQRRTDRAVITRQTDHCLLCHSSTHSDRVPGHIMRSVYSDRAGLPVLSSGTFRTDHTSPLRERFGGWYVTGTHGAQRHMGNEIVRGVNGPEDLDCEAGANVTDLRERLDTAPYLAAHSDLVALLVLAHQTAMHNQLTAANYSGQFTLRDALVMNHALDRPEDYESDSTRRRYASAAEKVLDGLLFVDEAPLTDAVAGTSDFAAEFAARGPFDSQGRSLRQFDLRKRLFRYPCSFLIYSEAFDGLPDRVRELVYRRLWEVLTNVEVTDKFAHLKPADRLAILEILRETKQGLPDYWREDAVGAKDNT